MNRRENWKTWERRGENLDYKSFHEPDVLEYVGLRLTERRRFPFGKRQGVEQVSSFMETVGTRVHVLTCRVP